MYAESLFDQRMKQFRRILEEVFKKKPSAVVRGDNGFWAVDYKQIDVAFREAVKHGQ